MASSEDGRPALLHPAKLKTKMAVCNTSQNKSPTQRLVTAISCREIPFSIAMVSLLHYPFATQMAGGH